MKTLPPRALKLFLLLVATMCTFVSPAAAAHPDEKSEIENLKQRIKALEAQQVKTEEAEGGPTASSGRISRHLTLHGLLEVEASYAKPNGAEEESDISLATAELSLEASVDQYVGGHLVLLYEEDDKGDSLKVDEAVISLTTTARVLAQAPSLHLGRMYLPFGMFNSHMISDPLTLELGETRKAAALAVLQGELWTFKAGVFNGDTDREGAHDNLDNWVASFEITPGENISCGISYLSDLAESDNELVRAASLYADDIPGGSAFLSLRSGVFGIEAEYLAAFERFAPDLVVAGGDLTGRRPRALNFELVWMPTDRLQLGARYEQAKDFMHDLWRYGTTLSYGLYEHAVVALEYLYARNAQDGSSHQLTTQLALEF